MDRLKKLLATKAAFVIMLALAAFCTVRAYVPDYGYEKAHINPYWVAIAVALLATALVTRPKR